MAVTAHGHVVSVEWRVIAGDRTFTLRPLLDDQENDARLSTGAIYWEGAVTAEERGARAGAAISSSPATANR